MCFPKSEEMKKLNDRFLIIAELISFLWEQRLWWLIPMVLVFLVAGAIILFVGSSPLAPIVYPLF